MLEGKRKISESFFGVVNKWCHACNEKGATMKNRTLSSEKNSQFHDKLWENEFKKPKNNLDVIYEQHLVQFKKFSWNSIST